jgi:hypothetical protein
LSAERRQWFLTDKVQQQFSGTTHLRNTNISESTFSRSVMQLDILNNVKAHLDEDRTCVDKRHHRTNNKESYAR